MSIKAIFWAWDHSETLPATELLVLLALANFANDSNSTWYSYAKISKKINLNRRTVMDKCASLQEKGFLTVRRRQKAPGQNDTNLFVLNIPKHTWGSGEPDSPPSEPDSPPSESHSLTYGEPDSPPSESHSPKPYKEPKQRTEQKETHAHAGDESTELADSKKVGGVCLSDLPDYINPEDWADYAASREKTKKPLDEIKGRALLKRLRELHRAKIDVNAALQAATINGWLNVYPDNTKHGAPGHEINQRNSGRITAAEQLRRDGERVRQRVAEFEREQRASRPGAYDAGAIDGEFHCD